MYVAKGLDPALALEVARQLSRDPAVALDVHVREELGLDPGELPSATLAAGSSFVSFALGAFLPLLPYLLGANGLLAGPAAHPAGPVPVRRARDAPDAAPVVVRRRPAGRSSAPSRPRSPTAWAA